MVRVAKSPKLIVFDLDHTLWPFFVEFCENRPFHLENEEVCDTKSKVMPHYKEVPSILEKLKADGHTLAIASRSQDNPAANQLVDLFGWGDFFSCRQIYPGTKIHHFKKLHKEMGIALEDMLFFDDDDDNIRDTSTIGVTAIKVDKEGMTFDKLEEGLNTFASRSQAAKEQ